VQREASKDPAWKCMKKLEIKNRLTIKIIKEVTLQLYSYFEIPIVCSSANLSKAHISQFSQPLKKLQ